MSPTKRYAKKQAQARQRRRHTVHARLRHDQPQAQQAIKALAQALDALGLPANLVKEIEGRLRRQQPWLGTIFGLMLPSLFGCRTSSELARVRGWDKNVPPQRLGALPKRSWLQRLRRLGLGVLVPLGRHVQHTSAATPSRWQWTWVVDDAVCKKDGTQLGVVGTWWSGQAKRLRPGMDGVLLVVVIGDGKVVVPVDFALRRPDPQDPGGPCRATRRWVQVMLDDRLAALGRHGLQLPPPVVVAESWLSDSKLMGHVSRTHQGTLWVEGTSASVFVWPDGQQVKGTALLHGAVWSWRAHPWEPPVRYARVRATSPTYGAVTVVLVDEPGQERFSLRCVETTRSAPQLIRRWRRRTWMALVFRTLKHLVATEACQGHNEDAYYGQVVLRLMACFVLLYTARVVCKGRMTMEESICSLKHSWRFVDSEALE